jgi:hypothetical protein
MISFPTFKKITESNPVLLVQALQSEVKETRKPEVIDDYLLRIQHRAFNSDRDAERLVTAGVVPVLIQLLKYRGVTGDGLETVMVTLGLVAHDPISANTVYRTNTASTLIEILRSSLHDDVATLAVWCLNRMCRSVDIAVGLMKMGIVRVLTQKLMQHSGSIIARNAAWCLGGLIFNDGIAEELGATGIAGSLVSYLGQVTTPMNQSNPDDICAALHWVLSYGRH